MNDVCEIESSLISFQKDRDTWLVRQGERDKKCFDLFLERERYRVSETGG
jgi:hypothetical protein